MLQRTTSLDHAEDGPGRLGQGLHRGHLLGEFSEEVDGTVDKTVIFRRRVDCPRNPIRRPVRIPRLRSVPLMLLADRMRQVRFTLLNDSVYHWAIEFALSFNNTRCLKTYCPCAAFRKDYLPVPLLYYSAKNPQTFVVVGTVIGNVT